VFSTVDSGLTNLIYMTVVVVLCSHCRLSTVVRVYFTVGRSAGRIFLTDLQRHPYLGCSRFAGCVHSWVNKPGTNGGVSYDSLTHSRYIVEIGRKIRYELSAISS